MGRKFLIAKGRVGPAFDTVEERARARYLRVRQLPGSDWVITDAGLYTRRTTGGRALEVELQAAVDLAEMLKGEKKC
jgi:hypothetical protein